MTKKSIVIAVFFVALLQVSICVAESKYQDLLNANDKFIEGVENYTKAIDESKDAKGVTTAINSFAAHIEKIGPEMRKALSNHPELQKVKDPSELPKELLESNKKAESVGQKMAQSFAKIMPYRNDKSVQEAQAKLGKAMMALVPQPTKEEVKAQVTKAATKATTDKVAKAVAK